VAHLAGQAIFGLGVTVAVIVGIVVAYRRRHEIKQWLLAHERHPLVRPLFVVGRPLYRKVLRPAYDAVAPELRFLWNRVTPGELGLELSTAIAVAGVGIFVFVLYIVELSSDLGPTPLDTELLDLSDKLYNAALVDVAKVVSAFGALPTVLALVAVTSVLLVARRRWTDLVVLIGGTGLIYAVVHIAKAAIDRPRPADPLVETSLSSFPSGHAAYATVWIAVALIVTRRIGLAVNATLVTVAIVLAAAIGFSRIYLRAHYWSDVAAGWGIGCGIFAALAAIALIVNYVRHNGGQREPEPPLVHAER
jgi:undecaprenyl-diphosphatase